MAANQTLRPLPKRLCIEGLEYKVVLAPGLAAGSQRFAEVDFINQRISIDATIHLDQQWESLLHEILHCITQGEAVDEPLTGRLGRRLFGALVMNGLLNIKE